MRKCCNQRKIGVTQTIIEGMENNLFQYFGHVARMEDNKCF
jgi:hypothetical protein